MKINVIIINDCNHEYQINQAMRIPGLFITSFISPAFTSFIIYKYPNKNNKNQIVIV